MNGPSRHVSWDELACKDGTPYPLEWRRNHAIQLAEIFEIIRSSFDNKPIKILSAYRTLTHNRKIGGAVKSQHLFGRALDIRPPDGYSVKQVYDLCKEFTHSGGIRGLGLYKTFVHFDVRPKERCQFWYGVGLKDDGA